MTMETKKTTSTIIGEIFHPFIRDLGKDPDTIIHNFLKEYEVSDAGNTLCVYDLYGDVFRFTNQKGLLWYNGKYWESDLAEAKLQECIINTLTIRNHIASNHFDIKEMKKKTVGDGGNIGAAKRLFLNLTEIQDEIKNYNKNWELLNVENGVVNLKTLEIKQHSPEHKFTYCVPVAYKPGTKHTEWDRFLSEVVGNHELLEVQNYLQMVAGYTVSGYMNEECLFYFYGPGRSGKSTFIKIFTTLLTGLSYGTSFNTFTKKRSADDQGFDVAPMFDKRFISASESERTSKMNEAVVKSITGRDAIRASFKGKDQFSYTPQFKIWVSSNNAPNGDVDDDAFWARLRLISFPHSFIGKEDKQLKDQLLQPEVLEAVLVWAIEGAKMYFDNPNGLKTPQVFIDALQDARDEADIVKQFLDDADYRITGDENDYIGCSKLYGDFEGWCIDNQIKPWGSTSFYKSLGQKGCINTKKQKKLDGSNIRCVTGIKQVTEDANF